MATPLFTTDTTSQANLLSLCEVVSGAIVSKPVIDTGSVKLILFSMDAGQEISQHKAPFPAIVQMLSGRIRFGVTGEDREITDHDCIIMQPDEPHDLTALEPSRFLLTLLKSN